MLRLEEECLLASPPPTPLPPPLPPPPPRLQSEDAAGFTPEEKEREMEENRPALPFRAGTVEISSDAVAPQPGITTSHDQ